VKEFKYLEITLTYQIFLQEEIKERLKPGNACYHSVQDLLSSSLLSKNLKIKILRTIILSIILYECDSLLLTFREERRLRVFENRVLRRIFEPKRNEVTGEWRKLNKEELYDLYYSTNFIILTKSRRMRRAGHVARNGERRCAYRILVSKPEGNRPLARPRRKWGIPLRWIFWK
jgi:hypothetical protein